MLLVVRTALDDRSNYCNNNRRIRMIKWYEKWKLSRFFPASRIAYQMEIYTIQDLEGAMTIILRFFFQNSLLLIFVPHYTHILFKYYLFIFLYSNTLQHQKIIKHRYSLKAQWSENIWHSYIVYSLNNFIQSLLTIVRTHLTFPPKFLLH